MRQELKVFLKKCRCVGEVLVSFVLVVVVLFLFELVVDVKTCLSAEKVCMTVETAKEIVVELERYKVMKEEIEGYEKLVANLKEQNRILEEQNRLLREQVELLKSQRDLYRVAYEEERRRVGLSVFDRLKWAGMGFSLGVMFMLLF